MKKCKIKNQKHKSEEQMFRTGLFWRTLAVTFILIFSFASFAVLAIQIDNTCRKVGFGLENKYNFYIENDGEHVSVAVFNKVFTFDISNGVIEDK